MTEQARASRRAAPRVFTIPPGAPFLTTMVAALLDGRIIPGFSAARGPLALADATIYVPTRRSGRALAAAFAEHLRATGTLLPRILPLGDPDAIEADVMLDAMARGPLDDIPTAIDPLSRRMTLTRLILGWSRSLRGALLPARGDDGEPASTQPLLVGTSPVDAWHLSGELAALLDELSLAGLDGRALQPLGTDAFDRYWGITLEFLKIATEHWPAILAERRRVDPATRQAWLIDAEIARLSRDQADTGPVIVAGVVGSDPLTLRLVGAIAALPRGAVVLPGLDQTLDDAGWAQLGIKEKSQGHPQAALHALLAAAHVARSEVTPLGVVADPLVLRGRLISEALRPAETTDAWQSLATGAAGLDRTAALSGVTLIEAADEREEALALAIAMREVLEGRGTAVLVTPDRTLARRVREELARWGIEIDDSGGETLAMTAAGALARLALDCVVDDIDPVALLALLAHPAVCLGLPRRRVERLRRTAERFLLRGVLDKHALRDPAQLIRNARLRAEDKHAPRGLRGAADRDFAEIERLLGAVLAALAPLRGLDDAAMLSDWIAAHDAAVAVLTATDDGTSALGGVDGTRLATLFDELAAHAEPAITLSATGYAALFGRIATETAVRGPTRTHPRLKILGLLEFRLLSADRVLLGGLDEAIWPPQVKTDAFLNRPMRTALGLAPPEQRIGQAAHDFEMALGQPEVIVSRAAKRGGAPTVPSRFLQRLAAVAGESWAEVRARGRTYLDLARGLDRPARPIVIGRPSPKPPVALRPDKLSVTRIETLRRDPYAIYAERILKLRPVEPIGGQIGPREWGTAFHGVLRDFVDRIRHGPVPDGALAELLRNAQTALAPLLAEPHTRAFMAPRVERWVHGFHAWDGARRGGFANIHVEAEGRLTLALDDQTSFELTATADRIERSATGGLRIVDYKTGAAPSNKEIAAGFAPQLTLEAAIALGGGFAALDAVAALDEALYVKFGTGRELAVTSLKWKDRTLEEVVSEHLAGLRDLLNAFRDPSVGYLARPYPQFVARFSDYDHLSRVKEWSATGGLGDPGEGAE